jgi:hypothetical protein
MGNEQFSSTNLVQEITEQQTKKNDQLEKQIKKNDQIEQQITNNQVFKCAVCLKKLRISYYFKCHCGGIYCIKHRVSCDHNCQFDYKKEYRNQMIKENRQFETKKVESI